MKYLHQKALAMSRLSSTPILVNRSNLYLILVCLLVMTKCVLRLCLGAVWVFLGFSVTTYLATCLLWKPSVVFAFKLLWVISEQPAALSILIDRTSTSMQCFKEFDRLDEITAQISDINKTEPVEALTVSLDKDLLHLYRKWKLATVDWHILQYPQSRI